MTEQALTQWFHRLGQAWTALNPDAVLELFTDDIEYHDSPFAKPLRGCEEVLNYWRKAAESQKNVHFTYRVIAISGHEGFGEWSGSFTRANSNKSIRCGGVIAVMLNDEGKCRRFREWRVVHEE